MGILVWLPLEVIAYPWTYIDKQGNLEKVIIISEKNCLNFLVISRRQKIFVTNISIWDLLGKYKNSQDGNASKFCYDLLHKSPVRYKTYNTCLL